MKIERKTPYFLLIFLPKKIDHNLLKMAQVVPDICPREKEFAGMMKQLRDDLVRVAHGNLEKHTAVLFCGSGTINIDICLNSLLPEDKRVLIVNNGAYSTRAVEVCQYYGCLILIWNFPFTNVLIYRWWKMCCKKILI